MVAIQYREFGPGCHVSEKAEANFWVEFNPTSDKMGKVEGKASDMSIVLGQESPS